MNHIYQPKPDAPAIKYVIECAYVQTNMTFSLKVINPQPQEYKGVFVVPMGKNLSYDVYFLDKKVDDEIRQLVEWHVAPTLGVLMRQMDSFGENSFSDVMRLLCENPETQQKAIDLWNAIGDLTFSVVDCLPKLSEVNNELPLHF